MNKLFNVLPLLVGLFFVALIFLIKRVQARGRPLPPAQPPRQPLIKASAASLKAFRQRFARRRWLHRLLTYPALGFGVLVLFLGVGNKRDNALIEFLGPSWREFGFCALVFGVLALHIGKILLLRCPACGNGVIGSRFGFDVVSSQCPHCRLQLS